MTNAAASDVRWIRLIWVALALTAAGIAGGGPLQVLLSKSFWCGRAGSGTGIHFLMAVAAAQLLLYLLAQYFPRAERLYLATQWGALAICAWQVAMLVQAYPVTFSWLGLSLAVSIASAAAIICAPGAQTMRELHRQVLRQRPAYMVCLATIIVVTWIVASSLVAQYFLYRPATPLTALPLAFCLAVGAAVALYGGWSFHTRNGAQYQTLSLTSFPPSFVLLLALLRAKHPDAAFDTFLYKGTWPYQIAEWRTAGMAALDHVGLGSNFQEMLNGVLLILADDYNPSLISTLSIGALFAVLPCCINLSRLPHGLPRLVPALSSAIIFSLTESALAQGTTYQEPFMVLTLTLALINARVWPIFVGAAIAAKLTAAFAAPLIFVLKFAPDEHVGAGLWRRRASIVGACLLMALAIAPQIDRNLLYSGRIGGFVEALAEITDPAGNSAMLLPGYSLLGPGLPRGSVQNNFVMSACNMFALELLCDTKYRDDDIFGFHIIPSSRSPLVGLALALALLATAIFGRTRFPVGVLASLTYIACYLGFLTQVAQGRYFVIMGFACAILLLCVGSTLSTRIPPIQITDSWTALGWILLLSLVPIGDLLVGIYSNDGWDCRRPLFARYATFDMNRPKTDVQRFVADFAAEYRERCPTPGLSPTVVAEPGLIEGAYLGIHVATASWGHDMRRRFFAIDIAREKNIALAIAAVVARNEAERAQYTRSQDGEFVQCFENKQLKVYCSKQLAPMGSSCARSLYDELAGSTGPAR